MRHLVFYNVLEKNLIKMIKEARKDYRDLLIKDTICHGELAFCIYANWK